ncbi:MAG: hypothetical protein AAFW69_09310, partial [Pseudomonadota bacterium]
MTLKTLGLAVAAGLFATAATAEIRIAHIYGKTGPFEAYAAQSHIGLMMGRSCRRYVQCGFRPWPRWQKGPPR